MAARSRFRNHIHYNETKEFKKNKTEVIQKQIEEEWQDAYLSTGYEQKSDH